MLVREPKHVLSLSLTVIALALLPFVLSPTAQAQSAPEQTIWLKNGGFLRGALVELIPGDHVTVQLATGELRRIPAAEIDRMSTQMAPSEGSASMAPTTPVSPFLAPSSSSPPPVLSSVILRVVGPQGAKVQTRARLERGPWATVCGAPCDLTVPVVDREFRASGAGIQPSRTFLIEPGERPVRIELRPGSADLHTWGTRAYLIGLPVMLLGGVGIGLDLGTNLRHGDTIGTVGIVTAAVGGAMILASLPLLYMGQTRVLNEKSIQIAKQRSDTLF